MELSSGGDGVNNYSISTKAWMAISIGTIVISALIWVQLEDTESVERVIGSLGLGLVISLAVWGAGAVWKKRQTR
jgi:hypothetical protein